MPCPQKEPSKQMRPSQSYINLRTCSSRLEALFIYTSSGVFVLTKDNVDQDLGYQEQHRSFPSMSMCLQKEVGCIVFLLYITSPLDRKALLLKCTLSHSRTHVGCLRFKIWTPEPVLM